MDWNDRVQMLNSVSYTREEECGKEIWFYYEQEDVGRYSDILYNYVPTQNFLFLAWLYCVPLCAKPNQTKVVKAIFLVHISKTGDAEDQWHLSGD